jgi:hypothetical protein
MENPDPSKIKLCQLLDPSQHPTDTLGPSQSARGHVTKLQPRPSGRGIGATHYGSLMRCRPQREPGSVRGVDAALCISGAAH